MRGAIKEHFTAIDGVIVNNCQLGHYQILHSLGEGGFGEVYEAWDTLLCRRVAIKRLKCNVNDAHQRSLIKEARLAASLHHPAFVKIYSIEENEQTASIVMELVSGVTLKQWIKNKEKNYSTSLGFISKIAEAMYEAHESGLVHGDLKPSNLIVEPSGNVRILDFGLAIKSDQQETTSLLQFDPQGTVAYMAPECLLSSPLSKESDIYALGVILYELLNGERPFPSLNGLALAAALMQSTSDNWCYDNTIPTPLINIIRDMTARVPDRRLCSMKEVYNRIQIATLQHHPRTTMSNIQQKWLMVKYRKPVIRLSIVLLLTLSALSLAPNLDTLTIVPIKYSQSAELNRGLAALRVFDRPGSLDTAYKSFNKILRNAPGNAAAVAGLSITYSFRYLSDEQDEIWLKKADASAQQSLKLNDQLALSQVAAGMVLALQGNSDAGLQRLEQALNLDPKNFFAWDIKGTTLIDARRYAEAQQHAESALRQFPTERIFADQLGTIYYTQNNYAAAEQAFRLSLAIEPDSVYAYANLSAVLLTENRNDEALQVLQEGLQIRPSAMLYTNLGNIQFFRGNYVAAVTAFEYAVSADKGDPANYPIWAALADGLLWLPGREDDAIKAYQKAKELLIPRLARNKNDVLLVSRMGLYSARLGEKTDALQFTQQALALANEDAYVHFRAGLTYELIGERALALKEMALAKALKFPVNLIEAEPDLVALRRDINYQKN